MDSGCDSEKALSRSLEKYKSLYGEDKVTMYPPASDHLADQLWNKVRERIRQRDTKTYQQVKETATV